MVHERVKHFAFDLDMYDLDISRKMYKYCKTKNVNFGVSI